LGEANGRTPVSRKIQPDARKNLPIRVVGASFAPTHLASPLIGVISILSNASNSPGTLNLSGNVLSEDPSTITLGASANPIQMGNLVYFTAKVTSSGVTPTGQVTLLDGTASLGSFNLDASGVATFAVPNLVGAPLILTVVVSGGITMPTGDVTFLDGSNPLGHKLAQQNRFGRVSRSWFHSCCVYPQHRRSL
jgi:Bacterial Ig-like domain (group 3)